MHTDIPKRNLKTISVPNRAWSVAAGKDFFMQSLHWRFNVHYIQPGGNCFNVNVAIVPMQDVVLAATFHQGLRDKRVEYTQSQINSLPFESRRAQSFQRQTVSFRAIIIVALATRYTASVRRY